MHQGLLRVCRLHRLHRRQHFLWRHILGAAGLPQHLELLAHICGRSRWWPAAASAAAACRLHSRRPLATQCRAGRRRLRAGGGDSTGSRGWRGWPGVQCCAAAGVCQAHGGLKPGGGPVIDLQLAIGRVCCAWSGARCGMEVYGPCSAGSAADGESDDRLSHVAEVNFCLCHVRCVAASGKALEAQKDWLNIYRFNKGFLCCCSGLAARVC